MSWYLRRLPRSHQLARVLSYLRLGTATLTLIRLRFACLLAAAAFSKIQDRYYYELRLVGSHPFTMSNWRACTIGQAYPSGPVLQHWSRV